MKFMLIHWIDETGDPFGDDVAAFDQALDAWDAEMIARGILVGGGRLEPSADTTAIRVRGGEVMVSDGPFAETKEQIAGYAVLECADRQEAIKVAARHPTAAIGTFELRRYLDEP